MAAIAFLSVHSYCCEGQPVDPILGQLFDCVLNETRRRMWNSCFAWMAKDDPAIERRQDFFIRQSVRNLRPGSDCVFEDLWIFRQRHPLPLAPLMRRRVTRSGRNERCAFTLLGRCCRRAVDSARNYGHSHAHTPFAGTRCAAGHRSVSSAGSQAASRRLVQSLRSGSDRARRGCNGRH